MVVLELQHRLEELNIMKLREPVNTLNIDSYQKLTTSEPLKFLDLHLRYGKIIKNHFVNNVNHNEPKRN